MKKILYIIFALLLIVLPGCDIDDLGIGDLGGGGVLEEKIKTTGSVTLQDVTISASYVTYYITPSGFDYDKLINKGYTYMTITFTYDVSYKKTWNSLDFLYTGAPKYDIAIKDNNNMGVQKEGLKTYKNKTSESLSGSIYLVDLKNNQLMLEIGSTNIQNDIYFTNLNVSYRCGK